MPSEQLLKILIVDDDEIDRLNVRRALTRAGLDTDIDDEAVPERVLERVQRQTYDCIILDYSLPGQTGTDVIKRLRAKGITTPIVVLTGQGSEDIAVQLMKAGAADYLSKSQLTPGRLARRLRNVVRVQRAEADAREALRQLAAERELLKGVLQQMLAGVIIAELPAGKLLLSNDQVETILGHRYVGTQGDGDTDGDGAPYTAYHADGSPYAPSDWPLTRTIASHETIMGEELECQRADDRRVVLRASSAPVRDSRGELIAAVMTLHDITRERRVQEALREEAQLIETLDRIGSSLTSQLDRDKLVEEITREATKLAGAQFGVFYYSMVDNDGSALHHTASGVGTASLSTTERPGITPMVARIFRPDGVVRLSDITTDPRFSDVPREDIGGELRSYMAVPVISASGDVIGGLFFGHGQVNKFSQRDERIVAGIAGWAAVAMDNARLYEEAHGALRTRDDVLAVVSHDLRNPLNAIAIAAEELLDPELTNKQRERYVGAIRRGVRRSDRLIRDLLDVSKIEAGKLSVEPAAHSVEGLLEQAVRDHEVLAEERELTLRVQPMPDGMPKVIADRTRIIQVLGNLIGNAIRFTEAGGTIDLDAEHHDSVVHIKVSDTGAGIPVDTLPHIFNRYWQARQQRRAGAGLGLAIAKGIVEAHSGTIWVTSAQGVGTTFTFTLPIAG